MLKEQGLQYFDGEITYIDDDGIEKIKTIDYEENVQLTDFEIFLQNLFDNYANYKGRLKKSYIKMLRKRLTDYLNEEEHIKEK